MPDTDTSQMPALSLLVVDDDQDIRDLMAEYLRQHGFLVRVADGGKAMFESIDQEVPDLIVLDIMMPGEDGPLPVPPPARHGQRLVRAGHLSHGPRRHRRPRGGPELGADDYVVKPFQPRELLARIRAVLRRSGRAPALPPTQDALKRPITSAAGPWIFRPVT